MTIEHKSAVKVFVTFDVFVSFTLFGVLGTCPGGFDSKGCLNCPTHCSFCNSSDHCYLCDIGYSGKTCQHHCDNCKPGTRCDKGNRFCMEGCKDGRSGSFCNKKCESRCKTCFRNDTTECLTCRNNQTSEPVCPEDYLLQQCEGNNCTNGCLPSYWGETCKHRCPKHCSIGLAVKDTSSTHTLMVVVPILTVVLIILLGGIPFMRCWKREQCRRRNDSHHVVDRPLHTMGRHMENQRHSISMSWNFDVAYDNYDHLAKTSRTTTDKSETVVPEENGNYSYAVLEAGYKARRVAENTKQNMRE